MAVTLDNMRKMMEKLRKEMKEDSKKLFEAHEEKMIARMKEELEPLKKRIDNIEIELQNVKVKSEKAEKGVIELEKSVSFNEEIFDKKIRELHDRVDEENDITDDFYERFRVMEDRSRRNNLRVDGIKENVDESWEHVKEKTNNFFKDKLGVEGVQIERAHRTGSRKNNNTRTIVLKLFNWGDKQRILSQGHKLKDTGFYVNEDFSAATVDIRKGLFREVKRRRENGERVAVRYDKIITLKDNKDKNNISNVQNVNG